MKNELGIGRADADGSWNTYNAVYMLIECKEKYRFFSLFTHEDIKNKVVLPDYKKMMGLTEYIFADCMVEDGNNCDEEDSNNRKQFGH